MLEILKTRVSPRYVDILDVHLLHTVETHDVRKGALWSDPISFAILRVADWWATQWCLPVCLFVCLFVANR
jgi:hypothetical protein